ncbi:MAG: alpha/beta hydrolase family protein [Phenylobacterium sp.]
MKHAVLGLALAALLAGGVRAAPADGELVSARPCVRTHRTYEAYVAGAVRAYQDEADLGAKAGVRVPAADRLQAVLLTPTEFEAQDSRPSVCRQVVYRSDGLKVAGYIWEPADLRPSAKAPAIVALRGGNQDFGKFTADSQGGMAAFVRAGFIVVGVQYRGVDGGEGREEFGGADVRDVLAAVELARRLPETDPANIFLYGVSRGGMETLLALSQGAKVNAAAIVSPFTDPELEAKARPEMVANVWAKLIPDFAAHPSEALAARSGVRVARTVDLPPLLLLHGTADWRADPKNSTEVADVLKARRRPYALHIFPDDVHGLQWNWRERDRLIVDWFRAHMRR